MREKLIQLRYKTYLILLDFAPANGVHLSLLTGGGKLSTIKINASTNFRLLLILLPAGERGSYSWANELVTRENRIWRRKQSTGSGWSHNWLLEQKIKATVFW